MFKAFLEHGFFKMDFQNPLAVVISYIYWANHLRLRKCIHKRAPLIAGALDNVNCILLCIFSICIDLGLWVVTYEPTSGPGFGSGIVGCEPQLDPGFGSGIVGL